MSDDKKPAIRFKNYSDDWEQRKLGDVVQITMGQSPDGSTYSDEPSDYILVQGNADLQNGWVCPRIWTTQITKKADAGDLIMSVRAPAGAMGKTAYNAVIGRGVAAIKGNEFIYQLLVKMDMDGFWKTLSCGSTFESLNSNNIKNAEVKVPITAEQVQIGNFFQQLDNLITLQHRKYDKLQNLKKAMLEKMFPKNGSNVPEIRFKGFTDDWEQRKFSEGVSEIGDGLHGTPIYCEDGNIYFINGNNLVDGKIVISAETKKVNESQQSIADKSLDDTTILMSINGTIGNLAYYSGERLMLGKSAAYIKVSEFDKRFVYAYLQAPSVQGYFMDSLTGTTIKNLGLKAIREMIMFIPQDVDEQKRIGKFFDYLDHLITLHQRKQCILYIMKKLLCGKSKQLEKSIFWEQRKLGELGSLKNGMNFSKEAMGIGFPFVNLQNIFGSSVIDVTNLGKAMASDSQLKDYNLLNGDVLFVRSSVKLEGVGEAALVPQNLENTTYSGFIIRFRDEYGLDNNFKRFIFGIESVRNQIMAQATNSANKNISQTVLENLCLKIPNKSEQEKIGLYFSNLDKLITLHQRKP